jgi:hypothetical protein
LPSKNRSDRSSFLREKHPLMRSRGARLKGANLGSEAQVAPLYGGLAEFIIRRAFARPVGLAHPAIYDRCNQPAAIPEWISARSSSISRRPFLVSMCQKVQPLQAPEPCATAPTASGGSRNCLTGKSRRLPIVRCPASHSKKFRFAPDPNQIHISRCPVPQRGVSRSSRTLRRDAMDASGAFDESAACGRRSRVVLMPRRWHQVSRINPRGDGGKQARSPGRARRKPLKPLRGECRVNPV